MTIFRVSWPWETQDEPISKPWDGSYFGFGVDPMKRRCVNDGTTLLEYITSDEGVYLECSHCHRRIVLRLAGIGDNRDE